VTSTVRLVDRRPHLTGTDLLSRLVPPRRFASARFATYVPDPAHPSQARARAEMERFAAALTQVPAAKRWRKPAVATGTGSAARYLDGGYGVGKTHLLAAAWHEAPAPKAYLTFAELAGIIGFLGMEQAIAAFSTHRLLCIDEFELDDIAQTLMTVTFLRAVIAAGVKVVATSNSLPDRLGEGRFAADDFTREIAAIASHFEVVRIDGPDYRAKARVEADPFTAGEVDNVLRALVDGGAAASDDEFTALVAHLRVVPPVQVAAALEGLDAVVIRGLSPLDNQGAALLFVHLIDEIYDSGLTFVASGCPVTDLFPASYRRGGYRKKYGRCESRLAALLGEARVAARS
jgi:cell division protein ZapE